MVVTAAREEVVVPTGEEGGAEVVEVVVVEVDARLAYRDAISECSTLRNQRKKKKKKRKTK